MAEQELSSRPNIKRIVDDLQECINVLRTEFHDNERPINDGNKDLQRLYVKLEFLLQHEIGRSFLGSKKDYWSLFVEGVGSIKGLTDGIKYVRSNKSEFKTNIGRGRAFIRFCLMYQKLADSIQMCYSNQRLIAEYYTVNSVWRDKKLSSLPSYMISMLYDLNDVVFDLAPKGYDLDNGWPTFARNDGNASNQHWSINLSRASSMASLNQSYPHPAESPPYSSSILEQVEPEYSRIGELEDRLSQKNEELDNLKDDMKNIENDLKLITNSLIEKSTLIEELTREHHSKCSELIEEKLKLTEENQTLKQQLVNNKAESKAVVFTELQSTQADLNQLIINLTQEKNSLQSQLAATSQERDELKASNDKNIIEVNTLREQLETVTDTFESTLESNRKLENQVDELKSELFLSSEKLENDHREKLTSIQTASNQVKQSHDELEQNLQTQLTKCQQLESATTNKITQLQNIIIEKDERTAELSSLVETLEQTLQETTHQLNEKKKLHECLLSEYTVLETSSREVEAQLKTCLSELTQLTDKHQTVTRKVNELEEIINQKQGEINQYQGNLDEMKAADIDRNTELELISKDLLTLKEEITLFEQTIREKEETITILEEKISRQNETNQLNETGTQEKLNSVYKELDSVSQKLRESQTEAAKSISVLESVTQERDELEHVVKKVREEKELSVAAVGALRGEIGLVREELKTLKQREVEKSGELSQLQTELEKTKLSMRTEQNTLNQQLSNLKFQLSSQHMEGEMALQGYKEQQTQVYDLTQLVTTQERQLAALEIQLESLQEERNLEVDIHQTQITELANLIESTESELSSLSIEAQYNFDQLRASKKENESLNNSLVQIKLACNERLATNENELHQFREDNHMLKKRLVKLIKDKDSLWQRTDELSAKQRRLADIKWIDSSTVDQCMGCRSQFSLLLRKHHCRLCGRVFCYSCSNNWLNTTASSGKSRVCNQCFIESTQQNEIDSESFNSRSVINDNDDMSINSSLDITARSSTNTLHGSREGSHDRENPFNHPSAYPDPLPDPDPISDQDMRDSPTSTDQSEQTIEKIDQSHRSKTSVQSDPPLQSSTKTSLVQTTMKHAFREGPTDVISPISPALQSVLSSNSLAERHTPGSSISYAESPSADEFDHVTDEEIARSLGETTNLSLAAKHAHLQPLANEWDQIYFAESLANKSEEVTILAGSKHTVCVNVSQPETTLSWSFSSLIKSIHFGLDFRPSLIAEKETIIEVRKCSSHKQDISGELIAHNTGLYIFIFSNEQSRMYSKTVIYKFTSKVSSNQTD